MTKEIKELEIIPKVKIKREVLIRMREGAIVRLIENDVLQSVVRLKAMVEPNNKEITEKLKTLEAIGFDQENELKVVERKLKGIK